MGGEERVRIGKHPDKERFLFWDTHCRVEYLHPVALDFEELIQRCPPLQAEFPCECPQLVRTL